MTRVPNLDYRLVVSRTDPGADPRIPRPRPNAWRRWVRLPGEDKLATIEALATVTAVRVLLNVTPSALTARALKYQMASCPLTSTPSPASAEAIIAVTSDAVHRASLRVPSATCLVQAVAGWIMLRRRGVRATVRIGVQTESNVFSAHAWLRVGDRIVVGGEDAASRFVTLSEHRGE